MGELSAESAASRAARARLAPAAADPLRSAAPVPDPDDAALLRCIAQGDQAAMAEFYRLHSRAVLTHISLIVGERALAEEIFQDTMLAIWRNAGSFRGDARVRTWVIAIARRQARDRLRRRQLRVVSDTELAERPYAGPGPEAVAVERAAVSEVAEAITRLGRSHREVLGLVFGADLSLAETAEVLGVPVGTVKSRLTAARVALIRLMNENGESR
ncbi:MAG TPA: sigma-70 family RNA polymerase sigma factor [Streptosporangiaceae bacterium]|nr:sigma-70 family RNA polymerase sigma factor [Streptosporangiaceae bacterium]